MAKRWHGAGDENGQGHQPRHRVTELNGLVADGGTLYFSAYDGTLGHALWRTDGTEAGTSVVKQLFGRAPLVDVNGTLLFGVFDFTRSALWRSDGTAGGTSMVADLRPGPGDNYIRALNDANGIVYFDANGSATGTGLWRSDGTPAGTSLVREIRGFIAPPIVVRGRNLYFGASTGLWRSDGTPAGTSLVRGNLSAESVTLVKNTLYFVGTDKRHGREVWRSDGTRAGTRVVRNIRRGSRGSKPNNLTALGGSLLFTATDKAHGKELWRAGPPPCAKGKCKKG